MLMQLFFTYFEGKKVIDFERHVMEDFFPPELFQNSFKILKKSRSLNNNKLRDEIQSERLEYLQMEQSLSRSLIANENVLDDYNPEEFQKYLFSIINEKGFLSVPEFYNKAVISRQVFANLVAYNKEYTPSKETLYKIIFTLRLDYHEARELLSMKGFTISRSTKFDAVVGYCLENQIYEQSEIDELTTHINTLKGYKKIHARTIPKDKPRKLTKEELKSLKQI